MSERKNWYLRSLGLFIVSFVAVVAWQGRTQSELVVTLLDVGQGDAILLRTPRGNDILIDGGPDGRVVEAMQRHLPPSDRTLELVVLTHPDLDHVGGLPDVAERFTIERVVETPARTSSTADRRWEEMIARQGSDVTYVRTGDALHIDELTLKILWPLTGSEFSKLPTNETSVVILLEYGKTSWLFTGDAGAYVEERLAQLNVLRDVDVLKVGHHGSISSSMEAFLDIVKPEIALISMGVNNAFGHPHPVVLRRLEQRGVKIFRTDKLGDIILKSDGQAIRVTP